MAGSVETPDVMGVVPLLDGDRPQPEYAGSLSVPDLLGVPADAVEGLSFDTAHVFSVAAEGAPERRTLELRFGGEPLNGERFLGLLETVAPTPSPFGRRQDKVQDVLGDWVLYEGDSNISGFQELAEAHSQLRGWEQLGKEYWDLKGALVPAENFTLLPWMIPGNEKMIRPAEFIEDWGDADQLAGYKPLINGEQFVQLVNDIYGEDEARMRIVRAMRHVDSDKAKQEGLDLKGVPDDELFHLFSDLDIETRNRLVSVSAVQGTPHRDGASWSRSEKTERFTELYLERHCVTFETEDGTFMYAHGIAPGFDIDQAYAERTRIYFGNNRPKAQRLHGFDRGTAFEYDVMEIETVIGKQIAILPGSIHFQELGLVPAVRWTAGEDGKREPRHLPEHAPLTSYKQDVLSNAAGYMVLAYLQPQRRDRWRTEARLRGLERAQEMGPAQVPLIALQQARRLLDNDLVREAEGIAA